MATKKNIKKKPLVDKPYCSGTMSNSAFWGFIRSALRQKSRWWKPISDCKNNARRIYKGSNKRQKFEYQCNECKGWFPNTKINVDHIVPVGTLLKGEDLPEFVKNLFCEVDKLQVLCKTCHDGKTKLETNGRKISGRANKGTKSASSRPLVSNRPVSGKTSRRKK